MKNFHKWNSELQPDQQIPIGLEHLGEMVWNACATECAKLCKDLVKAQQDDESLGIYTWADKRWGEALGDLGNEIEDH